MKTLRVLVCGGRNYTDRDRVYRELNALCGEITEEHPFGTTHLHIIHGGAPGADLFADEYAVVHWCGLSEFPADWGNIFREGAIVRQRADGTYYDAAAGMVRNQRMLDEGRPDLVLAFPGGSGTADMIRRARRAGVEVRKITTE